MFSILLISYFILFACLTVRRLIYGLILIAAFLPSYLIRFQVLGLPMTLLEGMILLTVLIWIIRHGRDWKKLILRLRVTGYGLWVMGYGLRYRQWFLATLLFLIAATISVFVSPNLRAALGIWKAYFVEPILLFAVFISTIKTRDDLNKIIWGLVLGALPVALLAVLQQFTGWLIPNPFWQAEATRRVTSFFGYPNAVALYLAPLLPLTAYLSFNSLMSLMPLKSLKALIFCASLLAIVFTRSTGALVALAATLIVFGLLNKKTRWWMVGGLVALAVLIPLTPLKDSFQQEVFLRDRSGIVRLNMWAETVEMLKERPIFGAGLTGYQEAVRPYHILNWAEIYLYPHNLFLNFWTETGVLGLAAFLWLVVLFFIETRQCLVSTIKKYLLASMLIILIHGLVDVPYFKNDLAVMFWLLVGLRLVDMKICLNSSRVI